MNENFLKGLVNSFLEYYNGNGFYGIRRFGETLKKENSDSFYIGMIDLIVNSIEKHGYTGSSIEKLREGEEVKKRVLEDLIGKKN